MTKPFNWKLFLILWLASVFGSIAVLPYTLTLQSEMLQSIELPMPLPVLITLQIIQGAVIFAIITALGLLLANKIGLGAPIIEAWLNKESISEKIKSILLISIILGVIAGALIIVLDLYLFQPLLVKDLGEQINAIPENIKPPAWQGFLASFYGGIAEEVLLRLFFMSLLAWIGSFIIKPINGKANITVLWVANILAAIAFGVGHLPTAAVIFPALTTLVVIRIILLNSIGGIIFGWLYQTRGIESAMIAHFSADIVLHVLFAI
jgi:membrane protease YdiL (CAAX protease family)